MNKTLLVLLLVPWHPALAQDGASPADPVVEQISSSGQPGMRQITSSAAETKRPQPQLSTTSQSPGPAAQLATGPRTVSSGRQLSNDPRSAQSSPALSSRSQGRDTRVQRLAGEDRCDPAKVDPSKDRKCAEVIENRAAEYMRTEAPTLSPEQRLLLNQQVRAGVLGPQATARRLAVTGQADHSLETLGIASIALQGPTVSDEDKPKEDSGASDAAVAIINAIVNAPPPQ